MKELVKTFSILVVFLGCISITSIHSLADTTTDDNGEMKLKTDRIGQDSMLETEFHKETELEKIAPDLFKEQTRAAIETKQSEAKKAAKNLEKNLFVKPSEPSTALSDTKNSLFSTHYTVQYAEASNQNANEEGERMSKRMIPALVGFVAACCGGVFVIMRKILE